MIYRGKFTGPEMDRMLARIDNVADNAITAAKEAAQITAQTTVDSSVIFATVKGVHDDGLTVIFDDVDVVTDEHYRCNAGVTFLPGDRVKLLKVLDTYIVEYPVGGPKRR